MNYIIPIIPTSEQNLQAEIPAEWYLLQTKPLQEQRALQNLERQVYQCYLPMLNKQKLYRGNLAVAREPLFPRYLFVRLDTSIGWSSIRSTKGVSNLVIFGGKPAKIKQEVIDLLACRESTQAETVKPLFTPGDRLRITSGPFSGIECVYQIDNGAGRVRVLINMLSKQVSMRLSPDLLQPAN